MESVGEIVPLKRQKNSDQAKELLTKIYRYVLPIMKKHNFRVKTLSEFFPKNPNLLGINVNRGTKISIRLRYAHNKDLFLPFEELLGTMLHELTHNVHGPHDDKFFRFLDGLKNELQDLLIRGFKGDQFLGTGHVLSRTPTRGGSPQALAARAAARRRGHRLGGLAPPINIIDRRERMWAAAERRREADRVCEQYPESPPPPQIVDLTSTGSHKPDVIDLT